jgi:hypothetical protein
MSTTQQGTRQVQKFEIVELLPNLGWLTKCDGEKQHTDRQCQNQNISNAFHDGFFLKKMVMVMGEGVNKQRALENRTRRTLLGSVSKAPDILLTRHGLQHVQKAYSCHPASDRSPTRFALRSTQGQYLRTRRGRWSENHARYDQRRTAVQTPRDQT